MKSMQKETRLVKKLLRLKDFRQTFGSLLRNGPSDVEYAWFFRKTAIWSLPKDTSWPMQPESPPTDDWLHAFNCLWRTFEVEQLSLVLAIRSKAKPIVLQSYLGWLAPVLNNWLNKRYEIIQITSHALEKYREINLLYEFMAKINSSMALEDILYFALNKVVNLVPVTNASIMLYNVEEDTLEIKALLGPANKNKMVFKRGEGIAGKVLETGKAIIINEVDQAKHFIPGNWKLNNLICVPLKTKKDVLGVLNVSNRLDDLFFTTEEEKFLSSIAMQTAYAVENHNLIEYKLKNERLANIGHMASTIIHDIKNPLTSVKGFASLLRDFDFPFKERGEYANMIIEEVDRLVGMTEELLEFSRGHKSKYNFKKVNIKEFINVVATFLKRDFEQHNITLHINLDYTNNVVMDSNKMKRVFFNLASNARDILAKGDKGDFWIYSHLKDDNMLEFQIKDNGSGMPEKVRRKVFEPFVTHGKKGGTGLGLAITKKIVEDHGGKINVKSELNKGTTFFIEIPITQANRMSESEII